MVIKLEKYKLLILLLTADLVFILLHILYTYTNLLPDSLYSLARDRGYAEFFQYTKMLWTAILLLVLAVRQRGVLYFTFAVIFVYFLFDDALKFHENFGEMLADWMSLQPAFGLRVVDFGELLVSALFGLLFLAAIGLSFYLSEARARSIGAALVVLIIGMAFFGVALDMLEIITRNPTAAELLRIAEDGGEMLMMSIITWFVYRLNWEDPQPPDWQLVRQRLWAWVHRRKY